MIVVGLLLVVKWLLIVGRWLLIVVGLLLLIVSLIVRLIVEGSLRVVLLKVVLCGLMRMLLEMWGLRIDLLWSVWLLRLVFRGPR